MSIAASGYAAFDTSGHLSPFCFSRRAPGPDDVAFKVTHCGVCHTDLHLVRNDWGDSKYPLVPGHEIVGVITVVGSEVTKFKVGDRVGVGSIVRSCGDCDACKRDLEPYCLKCVFTHNGIDRDGSITYGGFSSHMVVNEKFVVRIPDKMASDVAAPLLCAGITVYSPMRHFGMTEEGKHLGVVGLGGVGHMAVKFGKAFGLKVTVISTSARKEGEAKELGADHFLVSSDEKAMKEATRTMDYIVDTASGYHELGPLLNLLVLDGKLVVFGIPQKPFEIHAASLIFARRSVSGSNVGGMKETQEMLDFCAEKGVTPVFETIALDSVNTAMDRLVKSDVKYRFVIDFGQS